MQVDQLQDYCLSKKGTSQDMPFDNQTLVFKVMGKMFMLLNLQQWERGEPAINVKCDPDKALELRAQFDDVVIGAWHMNKKHWNTIKLNASMEDSQVLLWITHSYDLVAAGLSKKLQAELKNT